MKRKIIIIYILFFITFSLFSFEVGDSLGLAIKNLSFDKIEDAPEYNLEKFSMQGINIKILQSSIFSNRKLSDFILHTSGFLIAYQGKTKLGTFAFVEYDENDDLVFFYDYDGDGRIDAISETYFIPPWILFKANLSRKYPEKFLALCGKIYREFNCIEKLNEKKIKKHNLEISDLLNSNNCESYDLYYAYLMYLTQIENENAYKILQTAENFLKIRFKIYNVPLFKLYIAESYFNLKNYNVAVSQFKFLKNSCGDSSLAEFYLACIDDVRKGTVDSVLAFQKKFPNMWILECLIE